MRALVKHLDGAPRICCKETTCTKKGCANDHSGVVLLGWVWQNEPEFNCLFRKQAVSVSSCGHHVDVMILSMHASCAVFAADITPERKKKYE
jgi:hypothetical protein